MTIENIIQRANDPIDFKKSAYEIIDLLSDELTKSNASTDFKTIDWLSPEAQLDYWKKDFGDNETTTPLALFKDVINQSIQVSRRGYVGHQVAPIYPINILTNALIAYLNNGMAVYEMGMAGNAMEKIVIQDLAKRFGLPEGATGFVTSGGSLGNLTALLAAKANYMLKNDISDQGKLAVLVSSEAHYSIERAFMVMGIPTDNIIQVQVDENFKLKTDLLPAQLHHARSKDLEIFSVIGCACSTSTGAYDDLNAIASFAAKHNIWFHVDAAHGGPAIFSDQYAYLLKGIEKADSMIMDFHKMMLVPSLSTAVFFRSTAHNKLTFRQNAKYLWQDQESEEWFNSGKQTFECTKPMSILHTYAILRLYGSQIYQEQIDLLYGMAIDFSDLIENHKKFELCCTPQSNIVCFRYLAEGIDLNQLNKSILNNILKDGRFYIVSTKVNDDFYLRITIMNTRTTLQDLELLLKLIEKEAKTFISQADLFHLA